MKKLIAVLAALLMLMTAAAAEDGPLSGGWTPSADPAVTEELQALFEKGLEGLVGVGYTPVAYLGSQVVAGTNHAFLYSQRPIHFLCRGGRRLGGDRQDCRPAHRQE